LAALACFETVTSVFPFSKIFQAGSFSGNLDPAIHLPIFTAGRLKAELYEKVAVFNEAVHAYNELILLSAQEIADSLTTLTYLHQEVSVRKDSLEVAKEQERYINRRFVHAINSRMSLLDAQNVVFEEELKLADVEYAKLLATILLIRRLGGGYGDE
jgi:multidrug efflux system outer membrane protein